MQDAMPSVRWLNFDYLRARGIVLSSEAVQILASTARKHWTGRPMPPRIVWAAPLMIPADGGALGDFVAAMPPHMGCLMVWLQASDGYRISITLRGAAWRHALPN